MWRGSGCGQHRWRDGLGLNEVLNEISNAVVTFLSGNHHRSVSTVVAQLLTKIQRKNDSTGASMRAYTYMYVYCHLCTHTYVHTTYKRKYVYCIHCAFKVCSMPT